MEAFETEPAVQMPSDASVGRRGRSPPGRGDVRETIGSSWLLPVSSRRRSGGAVLPFPFCPHLVTYSRRW